MLRRIRAHLQPEHALCLIHLDVAEHDVAVFHALAAKSQTAMHGSIMAVLDEHIIHRAILWCLVCPGSLSALDGDGIIVDTHLTAIYQYIVADINIDSIATWCLHAGSRGEDGTTQEADVVAAVDVIGPERTVLNMHILQGYVAGVADIDEARALCILVGAFAVPGAANPELLPIVITVAVDGSRTCYGEAVAFVGIDEG